MSVSDSGDFVVAWQSLSQDDSSYGIFARRFDSSGNPLDPNDFQVNTFTPSHVQDIVRITVSRNKPVACRGVTAALLWGCFAGFSGRGGYFERYKGWDRGKNHMNLLVRRCS